MCEKLKCFESIDSLAMYIFEKNGSKWEDPQYIKLKNVLSSLLIFEQIEKKKPNYISNESYTKNTLDYRYINLVGQLLENKENINIISWNYDIQFELALFKKFNSELSKFGNYIHNTPSLNFVNEYQPSLNEKYPDYLRLNGVAIFNNNGFQYDEYNEIAHSFFTECLSDGNKNSINSGIKYSWEEYPNTTTTERRDVAKIKVSKSDYVIAIGYSFPEINEDIDREIFKDFKGKLVIQNSNDCMEELICKAKNITTDVEIKYIDNLIEFWSINNL
jgi:hypothetical protein